MESNRIWASALIVSELADKVSHWNSNRSLSQWLKDAGILGLEGIDTRSLTKILREHGSVLGKIIVSDDPPSLEGGFEDPNKLNLVKEVSCATPRVINRNGSPKVIVVDCGLKNNQIRCLLKRGAAVTVVPFDSKFHEYEGMELYHLEPDSIPESGTTSSF